MQKALWDKYNKIVCNQSGSGNGKSDGIRANMNRIRLRPSTQMPSNSLKSGNGTPAFQLGKLGHRIQSLPI